MDLYAIVKVSVLLYDEYHSQDDSYLLSLAI